MTRAGILGGWWNLLLVSGVALSAAVLAARAPIPAIGALAAAAAAAGLLALRAETLAILVVAASFLSGWSVGVGRFDVRPEQAVGAALLPLAILFTRRGRVPLAAALLPCWIGIGLLGAVGEPEPKRAVAHALRLVVTAAPLFLLPLLLAGREAAERAWDAFLTCAVVEAAFALVALGSFRVAGTTFGITHVPALGYVHPHGTLLEPNLLGALAAAAGAALVLRVADVARPLRRRILPAAGAAICAAAVLASFTRAAWLALPLVAIPALALAAPSGRRFRRALLFVSAGAVGAGALLLSAAQLADASRLEGARSGFLGKVASLSRIGDDPNVRVRLRSYDAALAIWSRRPLVGAGHGALERIPGREDATLAWAGNLEVHLLADTGLLGLAAVLGVFAAAGAASLGAFRRTGARRPLERLAALAVLFLCAQATETSWLASSWVLLGLLLVADGRREEPARDGRRRILFVHPSDELYGSDRVLLDLVRRLDRTRFDARVVVSRDVPYLGRLSARLLAAGIPVERMRIGVLRRRVLSPFRFPRWVFDVAFSTLRLAHRIRRDGIEVVHANTVTVFPAAFAARLAGVPLVWHIHEIVTDRAGRGLLHRLVRLLATRVVVVSEAARQSLDAKGRSNAEVVGNGCEIPAKPPAGPPASSAPIVAFVGRISARKGPEVLLEAAARLRRRGSKLRLVFAGSEFHGSGNADDARIGEAGLRLRRRVLELGLGDAVEMRAFREELADLFAEARVIVSPSVLPESFGLVVLEAMAAARPVVASDLGGPRELVVHGETGFLVPPGDVSSLEAALSQLVGDRHLATEMGERGWHRAAAHFGIARMVRRFEEIYDEVAAGR